MALRRRRFISLLFLLLTACPSSSTTPTEPTPPESPDSPAPSAPSTGLSEEDWDVIYDGFGSVTFEEGTITMEPKSSTGPSETHAALALNRATLDCPVRDFRMTVTATTNAQLRTPVPNAWEVFWIFFNYLDPGGGKTTNYFILKTNGIELGKAFAETGQIFLFTAGSPRLVLGEETSYTLEKTGTTLQVSINGTEVLVYSDTSTEEKTLYDQAGSFGLYTEDARVTVTSFESESLDGGTCP